jgi:dedicator of cytokinesis protein 1
MLQSKKYSEAKTHRELKEKLFYDIIDCLDKGKMWEKGIEMCKELALQYELETLDYIRLSEILVCHVVSLNNFILSIFFQATASRML